MMSAAGLGERGEEPCLRDVIEEFGRILDLLRAQLEDSMAEAGRECAALGDCFGRLLSANEAIASVVAGEERPEVVGRCGEIRSSIDAVVVGLQYQDRLSQRLGHIRAGLDRLQVALRDRNDRSLSDWLALLGEVEQTQQREQSRLASAQADPRGAVELF